MTEVKKVSRASIYALSEDSEEEEEDAKEQNATYLPNPDLVFVDVDANAPTDELKSMLAKEEGGLTDRNNSFRDSEELEFPLFSAGRSTKEHYEESEPRGRCNEAIMKISLREPSPDVVVNERPKEYYYAKYSEDQKREFKKLAVTGEDILLHLQLLTPYRGLNGFRCVNLEEYNSKVKAIELHERKRRRPGKKKRLARIMVKERKRERRKTEARIEAYRQARLRKKLFHKRGGRKNKKKQEQQEQQERPKYRTE